LAVDNVGFSNIGWQSTTNQQGDQAKANQQLAIPTRKKKQKQQLEIPA
jgi:hypothetical protein